MLGWSWGWSRCIEAGVPLCLARLCWSFWIGEFVQVFLRVEKLGLWDGLQPLFGVELEWGYEGVTVEAQRFGFTMVLPAIWCGDRAAVVWQLEIPICRISLFNGNHPKY